MALNLMVPEPMKHFLIFGVLFVSHAAGASTCQKQLEALLGRARSSVVQNLSSDEPCYRAALLGRTQGRQGCFPPRALELKGLMTPVVEKARQVCRQTCREEGLEETCLNLTSQGHLVQWGIDSTLKMIRAESWN